MVLWVEITRLNWLSDGHSGFDYMPTENTHGPQAVKGASTNIVDFSLFSMPVLIFPEIPLRPKERETMVGNFAHDIPKIRPLNPNWRWQCLLRCSDTDFIQLIVNSKFDNIPDSLDELSIRRLWTDGHFRDERSWLLRRGNGNQYDVGTIWCKPLTEAICHSSPLEVPIVDFLVGEFGSDYCYSNETRFYTPPTIPEIAHRIFETPRNTKSPFTMDCHAVGDMLKAENGLCS